MLVYHYWRRGWQRGALSVFTLVCALSFGLNLALQLGLAGDAAWPVALLTCLTGLLPPLILHIVCEGRRAVVIGFYAVAIGLALLRAADDLEWIRGEAFDSTATWMLAAAGALALVIGRAPVLLRVLLGLMVLSVTVLFWPRTAFSAWMALLPDYLVLAFFCVTLYSRERLLFFDVVLRRGVYFAIGAVMLSSLQGIWVLLLLWMAAPVLSRFAGWVVDRWLLRRPADVERQFWIDTKSASTEESLREAAVRSLSNSFHAEAQILPEGTTVPGGSLTGVVDGEIVALRPRKDGAPYWSEDERLLQSTARTYEVLRENVRLREREQDLRLLASRSELRALRAQINPHFLFNSLNAIAGLIHTEPALADATVERLAEVFRYTLRRADKEWVRCEEELDFVQAYLAVQQARFRERLQIEWRVDEAVGPAMIPAMTIQPLVENAIVYGGSSISLTMTLEGRRLRTEVRDNGGGFPQDYCLDRSDPTHGLRNIRDRLRGYYGASAELRWESDAEGSLVMWEVPAERGL